MKIIPEETMIQMRALFESGNGIRATARQLGLSKDTVHKYYRQGQATNCGCGKPMTHKGWCSFRIARSPNRQRFLQEKFGATSRAVTNWNAAGTATHLKSSYIDIRKRLDRAWHRQAVMRENDILGPDTLIACARAALRTRCPTELFDDAVQDVLVLMLEGKAEAAKLRGDSLIATTINNNWALFFGRGHISLDSVPDEGAELHGILGKEQEPVTQEEFMEIAWRDFVIWAFSEPSMRAAFEKETGRKLIALPQSPIEAAIDAATSVHAEGARAFLDWVTDRHWGLDAAPAAYRAERAQAID